jgi:low molecular weight protein-tyrosine phosphatase
VTARATDAPNAGRGCHPQPPYRVIFVCLGNICRSPMAEVVFRHDLRHAGVRGVVVDSAGTGGWHVGDPMDRRARAVLQDHGYDPAHTAKQFTPTLFSERDLVLAMDEGNVRTLRRLAPAAEPGAPVRLFREFDPDAESLEVPDPYYGARDDFVEVLAQLRAASAGLVSHVQEALRSR